MASCLTLQLAALLTAGVLSASCQLIHDLDRFEDETATTATTTAPPAQGGGGQGGGGIGGGAGGGGSTGEGGSPPCTCVDPLPADVTGPFHVYSTPGATPVADCGGGAPVAFFIRSTEPGATCSACQCAPPAAPCATPTFHFNYGYTCDSSWVDMTGTFADNNCHYIGAYHDSGRMSVAPAANGSCTPSGGAIQTGDWGDAHGACSTTPVGGDCTGSQVCIAPPAAAGARLCVLLNDSAAACPPDWSVPVPGFRDTPPDTRTCETCTCGALAANCGAAFRVYYPAQNDCGGQSYIPNLNECLDFGDHRWGRFIQPQGTCSPSTTTVQGTFDPGTTATFCCKAPQP